MKDTEFDQLHSLPFSEARQNAFLGHALLDFRFFQQCVPIVKAEWFNNPHAQKIWAVMIIFFKQFEHHPTVEEILHHPLIAKEERAMQNAIGTRIKICIHETQNHGLDVIRSQMTDWLQATLFKGAVEEAGHLYNAERFRDAFTVIKQSIKQIDTISFDDIGLESTFDHIEDDLDKRIVEMRGALTFGLDVFDNLLIERIPGQTTQGCLLKGDTTLLLAPSNVGKTTCMITVAKHNIMQGKDVLFITHEGSPLDIKEKMMCSILGVPKNQLWQMYRDSQYDKDIRNAKHLLNTYFTYIPLNKAGLTVEEVEIVIRRQQEQRMAKTGKGYDLFMDDYPAKLITSLGKGGQFARRHMDEHIYNVFVQLALEYNMHGLHCIQTNREGSKINRGNGKEDRLLMMEDVLESWGPMTAATNVISLNRDDDAERRKRMTFYVCKSRSSEKGFAVVAKTDYARCTTHSNDLGGTWYKGCSTLADTIDELLEQYQGKAIPDSNISY